MIPAMDEQTPGDVFLSVVIPAFNEAGTIGTTLERVRKHLAARTGRSEIIVVDDGSGDGTAEAARRALRDWEPAKVISRKTNFGKGYSVREGILGSSGRLVLFSDADLSTPIEELDNFLPGIEKGCDVIIGTRAHPESDIQVRQPLARELMGKTFNLIVRSLALPGLSDTQCGFKLFRRKAALDIFLRLRTRGFAFDVEALVLCRALGYQICEVPVVWRNCPPSRVRMIGSSFGMLKDLVRILWSKRMNERRGHEDVQE